MTDGAQNALLGFVYQWVKTAELEVRRSSTASEDDDDFAILARRRIESERFGQDAVGLSDSGSSRAATLIQYKHSSTGREVSLDDFIGILEAFDRSRAEAEDESYDVDTYALVTNRGLARKVQEVMNDKGTVEPHPHLDLRSGKGRQIPKGKKKLIERHGSAEAAMAAWHRVVQRLDMKPNDGIEEGMSLLRRFGARHGVLQGKEWEMSLNRLYGAFVNETASGGAVRVDDSWLRLHLVGNPNAAALDFDNVVEPHIATRCKAELQRRIREQHSTRPSVYVERGVHNRIRECLSRHAVVFVLGRGGRGKSLTVARYLESVSNELAVVSAAAWNANEHTIVQSMTKLRLPNAESNGPDHDLSSVFARLKMANDNRRPLLLVDLDGIDEAPDQRDQLANLIRICWANGDVDKSPASVIATCRSETSDDPWKYIIRYFLMGSDSSRIKDRIGWVNLDDFNRAELSEAARRLNGEPEQRLLDALTSSRSVGFGMERFPGFKDVEAHVLSSLQSPIVWGGYASLEDDSDRDRVLDGDIAALDLLAEKLIESFWYRCWSRKRLVVSSRNLAEEALRRVAVRCSNGEYSDSQFVEACKDAGLGHPESLMLSEECLSYGVIEQVGLGSWRWTHPFVTSYLARRANGGHA